MNTATCVINNFSVFDKINNTSLSLNVLKYNIKIHKNTVTVCIMIQSETVRLEQQVIIGRGM